MKTTKLFPRQTLLLVVSMLMLVSLACSAIVQGTDTLPTAEAESAELTIESPATTTSTQPTTAPTKTATQPPPASTPIPFAKWQRISDLPRQINTLVVDPANPQVLYAGAGASGSGSGVYQSEDAGLTWRLAADGLPSEDVTALALSPDASPILYAAAGVRGDVYGSTDGAQSWTRLGDSGLFGFPNRRLIVSPDDGRLLFALGVANDIFRSNDGGHTWLPVKGGLPGDEHSTHALSLVIDPTNANVLYVGTGGFVGGGHGVYKSTDGGATWSPANRGMIDYRITALAVNPAQPQTLYAGGDGGELFKSTDGGQTWHDLTETLSTQMSDYSTIRDIVVDPVTPETIYLLADKTGVLLSHDGGERWRLLGKPGEPDYPVFTALAIIFDPQPVLIVGIEGEGGWRYAAD
jgi:photosystem II stability/assembly factor-like uncharacterized protein